MRRSLLFALTILALLGCVALAYGDEAAVIVRNISLAEYPRVQMQLDVPTAGSGSTAKPTFEVQENGRSVEILTAEEVKAEPVDVILAIDTSGSMKGASLDAAKQAARAFVEELQAESQVGVIAFSSSPRVVSAIGVSNRGLLEAAIGGLEAGGETALYDALRAIASQAGQAGVSRPVAVLLSDGGDTVSRGTFDQALKELKASNVPVLVVALPSAEADKGALATIASQSGGRLLDAPDAGSLVELYRGIAQQLQTTWNLTYVSNRPSTKDLDIALSVKQGDRVMTGSAIVTNPLFDPDASGDSTPLKPIAPASLITVAATALLVFIAVFAFVAGVALVLIRPKSALDRIKYYDQMQGTGDAADASMDDYSGRVTSSIMGAIDAVAGKRGIKRFVYDQLDRAGLPLRPTEYITIHLLAVIVAGMLASLFGGGFLLALVAVAVTTLAPLAFIEYRIRSRRESFEVQLPDVLNLIAGALRAGWGLQQSVDLVVEQMAPPVSTEFARAQTEIRLGRAVEDALESVAQRTESQDFGWAVAAIGIQRDVGGNLAEVLDVVAATIRDRAALRRQISGLTAEGRLSAYILMGLPFLLVAVLSVVNPEYLGTLFTTVPGLVMLFIGAVLLVIGGIWLRNIVTIEV